MYKVVVNLLPQNATFDQKWQVLNAVHAAKETMLQSADDAVFLVNNGSIGSKVKAWWPEQWPGSISAWLMDHGVQIVEIHPVQPPSTGSAVLGLHASADP